MFGYHFTTPENWQHIQQVGLKPCWIAEPNVLKESNEENGIWMYNEPLVNKELLGCLIWLMGFKRCDTIIELKIEFQSSDHIRPVGEWSSHLSLTYHGVINSDAGSWSYVKNKSVSILRNPVPSEQIQLHRTWALREITELDIFNQAEIARACDVSNVLIEEGVCGG